MRKTEQVIAKLDRTIAILEWGLYTGHPSRDSERWVNARARFLGDETVRRWVARARPFASADPVVARRLVLLERLHLDAASEQHPSVVRLRSRLQRRIVAFRPRFRGQRVDRARLYDELLTNPDPRAREEAYRAEDELWKRLESTLRSLVRARNSRARALGFKDYPDLRLGFEGVTVSQLRAWCDAAAAPLAARVRETRDDFLDSSHASDWFPWDLRYALNRQAGLPSRPFPYRGMVPAVRSALRRWGLPMERLPIRVTFYDLPFGGLTFPIRIPSDVRILLPPKAGWSWYLACFHEFGHAVHFSSIRQSGQLLRSPEVGFSGFAEGIGDLFEELAEDRRWLGGRPGLDGRQIRRFRAGRALENLVRAAGTTNWVNTELDLYHDPDAKLDGRAAARLRRVFKFDRFAPRSFVQTTYVTHPIYDQSYLISALFRKQLVRALGQQVTGPLWPNPRVGPWLVDNWFSPGALFDWIPRVQGVTGRPFGPRAFLESVRENSG